MIRKLIPAIFLTFLSVIFAVGQSPSDTVMILPFENTSDRPEFNWVGESFADSLSTLLKVPTMNVVSNQERKIIQQRLRVPLTVLPSLATSLKLARESNASLLIFGKYSITPKQGENVATINVTTKIIRVNEGRFLSEELADGRRLTRDIDVSDALGNLQTIQGQIAYQILYQRDKALPFSQNQFVQTANRVPARAFEAYIKGLLSASDIQASENYFKNAMRLFTETQSGETYSDAALELGHLYLSQKKFTEAFDYFSRVPENTPHYAEAAFYTGLVNWQQGNYEPALAVLRPLAEDLKLTSVYNSIGAIAIQASRAEKKNQGKSAALYQEGMDMLKKAADSSPDDTFARFNLGLASFLKTDYQAAFQQLRPVLAASPRDGEVYFLLAKAADVLKDPAAADFDAQAKRFLVADNKYAKLETEWQRSRNISGIDLRVNQPARKDFVSVVLSSQKSSPVASARTETEVLLEQAKEQYRLGRDDDAMVTIRKILASEPMSAESYLLLGNIHLRRGDRDQAVSSLKTALFWDSRLIDAHVLLGKVFLDRGDCLQAKNYAASALEIDKTNADAVGLQRLTERCSK